MERKIEGLLLSKVETGERNLIGRVLLRSGQKISVFFPGGKGGGNKRSSSLLEIGNMLAIELRARKKNSDLVTASEWQHIWAHKLIRNSYRAFTLLCFMVEIINQISVEIDVVSGEDRSFAGNFRVLSNSLYFLENNFSADAEQFHLALFLAKLLLEQGIFPDINNCIHTSAKLDLNLPLYFYIDQGGFALDGTSVQNQVASELLVFLRSVSSTQYKKMKDDALVNAQIVKILIDYFAVHMNVDLTRLKTPKLVSSLF